MFPPRTTAALSAFALCAAVARGATLSSVRREDLGGLKMEGVRRDVDFKALASRAEPIFIADFKDITYRVNVTIGGTSFPVQVDTGSADLWVLSSDNFKVNNQTNINVTVHYGTGQVTGPITFSDVQLGNFTVKDQAFLNATEADNPVLQTGAVGIMGLSFDLFSGTDNGVRENFGAINNQGVSVTSNIFGRDHFSPKFFDIYLERDYDSGVASMKAGGLFIGEHAEKYKDVVKAQKLVRKEQNRGSWVVAAEHVSVKGKQTVALSSSLNGSVPGQFTVLMDSGTSLAILAPELIDAIYAPIPGAVRFNDSLTGGQYVVPCGTPGDASFSFQGDNFPIHPLDLVTSATRKITKNGKDEEVTYCVNAFQYCIPSLCDDGLDGIFGDSFLKNVYASFNYGDDLATLLFGNGSFVQMLPVTDPAKALNDFHNVRQNQAKVNTELSPADLVAILSAQDNGGSSSSTKNNGTSTDSSKGTSGSLANAESDSQLTSLVEKYGPIIIGLLAGNLVVLLVLCVIGFVACTRGVIRSGARTRTVSPTYAPVRTKEEMLADPADYRD